MAEWSILDGVDFSYAECLSACLLCFTPIRLQRQGQASSTLAAGISESSLDQETVSPDTRLSRPYLALLPSEFARY